MAIYDFFLSRNGAPVNYQTYIGHKGRLFYDDAEKVIRVSDGSTPGGFPITPITQVATVAPTNVPEGQMWYDPSTLALWCYHDGSFRPTIDTATETKIGGIKLGPGVTTNPSGQLIIDTAGLDFSFGDFYAFTNTGTQDGACLSSINANQDVNIVSNGSGTINVVGAFQVHTTNNDVNEALSQNPVFSISQTGDVRVLAPNAGGLTGAVQIIGNSNGAEVSPNQTGVVVHITGNQDMVSRNYIDGVNNYALLAGRRYNGTAASPTNVKNGELFFRIAGQASTGTSFATFGPCQIDWVATEDQGPNNQGGELRIRATPNGSAALTGVVQVAAFNATTGVTATKFNGPLFGNVSATAVTATNITVTGNINGNLSGTTVTANSFVGTVITPAQPNITSVGTLTNLTVNSTISGSINGNAATATTATNLTAAHGILAGTISVNPTSVGGTSSATQTFTLNGLTTGHKIVITSGTALNAGLIIQAAWASATDTVSIQFYNTTNQAIDAGATTIQYFAWI